MKLGRFGSRMFDVLTSFRSVIGPVDPMISAEHMKPPAPFTSKALEITGPKGGPRRRGSEPPDLPESIRGEGGNL